MKVRKHFRTDTATIDYIISDFIFNKISDKDIYFKYCVNKRIEKLNNEYNDKLDKILSFIILYCDFDNLPLSSLSKIIMSLSRVTNVLSRGFMAIINK